MRKLFFLGIDAIIIVVINMEREVRVFDSFQEMNEANIKEARTLTPQQRLHNLTPLKRQYMEFYGLKDKDLQGHLKKSRIKKRKVPWDQDEAA